MKYPWGKATLFSIKIWKNTWIWHLCKSSTGWLMPDLSCLSFFCIKSGAQYVWLPLLSTWKRGEWPPWPPRPPSSYAPLLATPKWEHGHISQASWVKSSPRKWVGCFTKFKMLLQKKKKKLYPTALAQCLTIMKNLLQKNINHLRVKKWGDLSRQIAPIPTMSQSGPEISSWAGR